MLVKEKKWLCLFLAITKHPFQVNECGKRRGRPFFRVFWALRLREEAFPGRSWSAGSQQHPQGRGSNDVCCCEMIRTNRWQKRMKKRKISGASRICREGSIAQYYISLLSGIWNIDDQNRNPNINNRDHLVGQLTTKCHAQYIPVPTSENKSFEQDVSNHWNILSMTFCS